LICNCDESPDKEEAAAVFNPKQRGCPRLGTRLKTVSDRTQNQYGSNRAVAAALREAADLLNAQEAPPFRALAYQKAASTVDALDQDIRSVVTQGADALDALPNIGKSIAGAVVELVSTGHWSLLDRLRGSLEPEVAFWNIPGIGPGLAQLIHEHLHVDTLEALEVAAHDGRLATVPGIGKRRAAMIRSALGQILSRRRTILPASGVQSVPPVALLLDVDREYRARAVRGASTPNTGHGCRYCIRNGENGSSPRCFPTPPARTNWAAHKIG
jgi:DNA uptake protein ComE-like DNA-binding protein